MIISNGSGINVEPLSTTDSATLLHKPTTKPNGLGGPYEEDASTGLTRHLDGLQLVMTLMAGFMRRRQLSIRAYMSLYANDTRYAEIHGIGSPKQNNRYGSTLTGAFDYKGLDPLAMTLLQLLAFMNPDRAQEYIFAYPPKSGKGRPAWTAPPSSPYSPRDYLGGALGIWGDQQWYKNESARSSFLRGTHLISMYDSESVELGSRWVERILRREILQDEEPRELDTVDFDDLVCFWLI